MDLGLKDKNVLITGSSRGLGFACAQVLIEEGARVVINGRSSDSLENALMKLNARDSHPVFAVRGDVTAPDVPQQLIIQAVQSMGGLDILITNSGGPPAGSFESLRIPSILAFWFRMVLAPWLARWAA